jgi:hypothetical protein
MLRYLVVAILTFATKGYIFMRCEISSCRRGVTLQGCYIISTDKCLLTFRTIALHARLRLISPRKVIKSIGYSEKKAYKIYLCFVFARNEY